MLSLCKGVWHNPRIKKAKAVHTKVCTDACQSYSLFISCQTYCIDDWFVSNNM